MRPNYKSWTEEAKTDFEKRRQRVKKTCAKYGKWLRRPFLTDNSYMIDKNHHVAYCRHGKVINL